MKQVKPVRCAQHRCRRTAPELPAARETALIKIGRVSIQEFLDVVPDRRIIIRENSAEIAAAAGSLKSP